MANQKPALAAILKHNQKSYLLKDIEKDLRKLTETEKRILKARQTGKSFCEILEKRVEIDEIMLRGAAIYGCTLPHTEFFASFIAEELSAMILDFGFGEFTMSEMILALRINCLSGVKYPSGIEVEKVNFTGHTFNVDFVCKVLEKYMSLRDGFDRKIQNQIDGYE